MSTLAYRCKRIFDLSVALPGFVLLLPVMGVVALIILVRMGSPVIFRQRRPGLEGREFTLTKFRTMREARGPDGKELSDDYRLTAFGRFLRRTSLDEAPELWNVIRGDMSIVGPRPLLPEYLALYSPEQMRRHAMRPGLTGWAQINGRNALDWETRLKLDVWYVDHWSLRLDFVIVLRTLGKILTGEGVSQRGQATVEKFKGYQR